MPEYERVQKILKVYDIEQGCTRPVLAELESGSKVILKYPKNSFRNIILINEYIAYSIAKLINLSTPSFGIAVVDDNTQLIGSADGVLPITTFEGVCFFCEYIPTTIPASFNVLKRVSNLDEGTKLILFDAIVKNSDRYTSNVIVTANMPEPKMYIIDHSHAFGDPEWDDTTLSLHDECSPHFWQENSDFYEMLIRVGVPASSDCLQEVSREIQGCITEEQLGMILGELPDVWTNGIEAKNLQQVFRYVIHRVQKLDNICEMIIKERGI